jgi:hypothetical protein
MNDGGPAFPEHSVHLQKGMSLRDYFAAHALHNLRMNEPAYEWAKLAEQAYKYADAMLAARTVAATK